MVHLLRGLDAVAKSAIQLLSLRRQAFRHTQRDPIVVNRYLQDPEHLVILWKRVQMLHLAVVADAHFGGQ